MLVAKICPLSFIFINNIADHGRPKVRAWTFNRALETFLTGERQIRRSVWIWQDVGVADRN